MKTKPLTNRLANRPADRVRPFALLAIVFSAACAQTPKQDLAGEWRFALDRTDAGERAQWFARELAGRDRIRLPGILQAQGYGNDIATDTPWVLTLGDAWWKLQPAARREKFSQPGRVEVPFLAQPPKHYLGAAWYQRDIDIPAVKEGRRYQLFLERPHWETTVWVDEKRIGSERSLVAPHVHDLGRLTPGRHRLTIRIDNRQIVRDPDNDGHEVDAHAVSDGLGATWNGIVGRIELQPTPLVWLDDVQVFPEVATKSATVRVRIGNATGHSGHGQIILVHQGGFSVPKSTDLTSRGGNVTWDEHGGDGEAKIYLGSGAHIWDEFHPKLEHVLVLFAADDGTKDTRSVTFGLREVTWRDKDLLINGRVVNLRTTHFGGDFPLTGHPAMDADSWKRVFRRGQEFGLNGMRFHSWCPPEAAFTAADELGFYLQPECGLWAPFNPGSPYTVFLEEETPKLLKACGNHPSFVLFSPGNEPAGRYTQVTPEWAKRWHERDPRRLYSAGTGWNRPEQVTGGAQYAALVRFGRGELRNVSGWFGQDFRRALEDVRIPVLAHEIGQWCAYPDFDVIKKFTGYLRPSNYDIFRYIAEQEGVLEFNREFAWASGKFQLACYKEELEANLRTPGLAGHQMLDIRDYLGQGTALIGVLDAFWDPKSYVTASGFRRFHGATVPLARLAQRTFTTSEKLTTEVELYHFAENSIPGAKPYWKIVAAGARTVAEGEWTARDIPLGKNIPLGRVSVDLAGFAAPAAYRLVVGLSGTSVENDWNFWLYPAPADTPAPASVLVTSDWPAAEARLAAAGRVLFVPGTGDLDPAKSPPMKRVPVFWNIQMTVRPPRNPTPRFDAMLGLLVDARHPALAAFPTERYCDWQWTPLIDNVRSINLRGMPSSLKPIVAAIDDWNRNWRLGVIFEANVGPGKLLVCAIPLESGGGSANPGAAQMKRSLLDYLAGGKFRPAATLTLAQARSLWKQAGAAAPSPAARALDPDLDDGAKRAAPNGKR